MRADNRRKKRIVWKERRKHRYLYSKDIQEYAVDLGVPVHSLQRIMDENKIDYGR